LTGKKLKGGKIGKKRKKDRFAPSKGKIEYEKGEEHEDISSLDRFSTETLKWRDAKASTWKEKC